MDGTIVDIILIIIGAVLIIIGFIGCIFPVIPGPPLSYAGLIVLEFNSNVDFSMFMLIIIGILVLVVTILDYFFPIWATKITKGTKWGMRGAALGIIIGLFCSIWGVFFLPFIGAFVGELLYLSKYQKTIRQKFRKSLGAACGSFLGLIFGIALKLTVVAFCTFIFVKEIIISYY
jgi:uncharacterized protein YqgC (DUF456 family)